MSRQYSQFGNEPASSQRSYGNQGTRYRDERDSHSASRGYRQSERDDSNAPLEWDDRRYGRDFNDDPNDGGRGVYGRGGPRNRIQGGNQGWYGGQQGESYTGREPTPSGAMYTAGSARDSGRGGDYEGSDYGYSRGESQSRSQGEYGSNEDNEVVGSNWNRSRAGGEWRSENAGSVGQAYGRSSSDAYDQAYGRSQQYGSQYGGDQYRAGYGQGQYGQDKYGQSGQGMQERSHRGRGPKGYERSDERIKEVICEKLTDAPNIDASNLSVEVKNKEVTLSGTVSSRKEKFAAEELIERCGGVKEIHNQLKVQSSEDTSSNLSPQSTSTQISAAQGQGLKQGSSTQGSSGQGSSAQSGRDQDGASSSTKSATDRSDKSFKQI